MADGTDLIPIETPEDAARAERLVRRGFWRKLRRTLGLIPFSEDALAAWYCFLDDRTPTRAKAILVAALAYFIIPADTVPDFVIGLGFTDDAAVLLTALQTIRLHVLPEHYQQAREVLKDREAA